MPRAVTIATRLHYLLELTGEDAALDPFKSAPHFVIADEVVQIMTRSDVQRSIAAMLEAQIAHLPYPSLLVEFSVEPHVRRFVLLTEDGSRFRARIALMTRDRLAAVSQSFPAIEVLPDRIAVQHHGSAAEGHACALAASMALLMLNTRGIDKQIIEPAHLNKARRKSGKEPIRRHTVVRIGTIYDRAGKGVTPTEGQRRHMPVHLRAGHTRMQFYGPERSLRRPVYIPPVLVNYCEGEEIPKPARMVRV